MSNYSKTFTHYVEELLGKRSAKFNRVDIIFDTYKKNNLKGATQKKRDKRTRRKVENNSQPLKTCN